MYKRCLVYLGSVPGKKTVVRRVDLACGAIRALARIPRSPAKVRANMYIFEFSLALFWHLGGESRARPGTECNIEVRDRPKLFIQGSCTDGEGLENDRCRSSDLPCRSRCGRFWHLLAVSQWDTCPPVRVVRAIPHGASSPGYIGYAPRRTIRPIESCLSLS